MTHEELADLAGAYGKAMFITLPDQMIGTAAVLAPFVVLNNLLLQCERSELEAFETAFGHGVAVIVQELHAMKRRLKD